jgi:hypothetical protein
MIEPRTPAMKRKWSSQELVAGSNAPTMKRKRSMEELEEWIEETKRHSSPLSMSVSCTNTSPGIAWHLYEQCLKILSKAVTLASCKVFPSGKEDITSGSYLVNLKEATGSLYLWGEALGDGRLDSALNQFKDLEDTTRDLLLSISEAITQGNIALPHLTGEGLTGSL